MTARYIVGDVRAVLASLEPASVDLVLTSPPFLALRSYLPAGHPDKTHEIGSEPSPGAYIDTLLDVVEACARVLAPHGTMMFELGDTYAGSGGAGGDYNPDGLRDGQERFDGSASRAYGTGAAPRPARVGRPHGTDPMRSHSDDLFHAKSKDRWRGTREGWPLDRSLCLIPELFRISLVYGFNPLTGRQTPRWRARNVIRWCRPNPPVGALGDKLRPATSELVVVCRNRRYFDLDAVRTAGNPDAIGNVRSGKSRDVLDGGDMGPYTAEMASAGAPPLDWWKIPTQPYAGTATTYRREPCGPHDGGERTTSPDCPVHAGLPGQLPKALRDAHARNASSRTPGSDGGHAQEQLNGFAPTGPHPEPSTGQQSSDSRNRQCVPSAISHSSASHKTDHAPATKFPGNASAEMSNRTGHTPETPLSANSHPDTPENKTDEAYPSAEQPGTLSRTVYTSDPSTACTCTFTRVVSESTTSHYATWPEQLCVIPVKAMSPARVCRTCGKPSQRIVSEPEYVPSATNRGGSTFAESERVDDGVNQWVGPNGARASVIRHATTVGWTDCHHDNWRPGLILDPFAGSGTTLQVATGHGRDAIGIDLDGRNAQLALGRVGPLLLTVETVEAVA